LQVVVQARPAIMVLHKALVTVAKVAAALEAELLADNNQVHKA
jgi:hypothetical protein